MKKLIIILILLSIHCQGFAETATRSQDLEGVSCKGSYEIGTLIQVTNDNPESTHWLRTATRVRVVGYSEDLILSTQAFMQLAPLYKKEVEVRVK